ncbi:MAG: hypothetical protein Q9174_002457, partial [Haloplaca sp. 1 TL-2023]
MMIGFALRLDLYLFYLGKQTKKSVLESEDAPTVTEKDIKGNPNSVAPDPNSSKSVICLPSFTSATSHWGTRYWTSSLDSSVQGALFPKPYFTASMWGYLIGLILTMGVMQIAHHPQPALFYLVPCVLLGFWGTAVYKKQLRLVWNFAEGAKEEDNKDENDKKGEKAQKGKQRDNDEKKTVEEPSVDRLKSKKRSGVKDLFSLNLKVGLTKSKGIKGCVQACQASEKKAPTSSTEDEQPNTRDESGKKVLHIDRNDYYGGAEAASSLQEAETWVERINNASAPTPFSNASIWKKTSNAGVKGSQLGFSRAYSISLAPHLIYTRSNLVPALVSSKVYRQLEFLAVGSWWIYDESPPSEEPTDIEGSGDATPSRKGTLRKIPGSREDVFADKSINLRSTRSLMRILKVAADPEAHVALIEEHGDKPFTTFLESEYHIDAKLQSPLLALTLSSDPPSKTTVKEALPRLHRHLTSIGVFGPGFGAVVPKWGGLAEIAQVACRAGAVGGGVYVLDKGIESIQESSSGDDLSTVQLDGGDTVRARWIVGTSSTLPSCLEPALEKVESKDEFTHLTAIISSPLASLFPPPAEGSPAPAAVIVVLPTNSLDLPPDFQTTDAPLLYLTVHSSDTGECPEGQCIIYTSTSLAHATASELLRSGIQTLLDTVASEHPEAEILYTMTYTQQHRVPPPEDPTLAVRAEEPTPTTQKSGLLRLQDLGPSLALEDEVLRDVRRVWDVVTADDGEARGAFMVFGEREGLGEDADNDVAEE